MVVGVKLMMMRMMITMMMVMTMTMIEVNLEEILIILTAKASNLFDQILLVSPGQLSLSDQSATHQQ